MLQFRQARPEDAGRLSDLAYDAEACYGYSEEHMQGFRTSYRVSEDFIRENPAFIMQDDGKILGFWGLTLSEDGWELEFFYVAAELIRCGYGQQLWEHLIGYCRDKGIEDFIFVTGPCSIGFYERMGARVVGETDSVLDREPVPVLIYIVSK